MPDGSEELSPPIHGLKPHVELFRSGRSSQVDVPQRFQEQFGILSEGVYPTDPIQRMQQDGYNPVMIGYDHPFDQGDVPSIQKRLLELKEKNPDKTLKVAHEIIPPIQLAWIKDFLTVTEEYKTKGTMHGKIPDHVPEDPNAYRAKLRRNHAENLALWMLEQGFDVVPLDSPDVEKWISEDNTRAYGDNRQALTAIRRDNYGLNVMDKERPDIITTGNAHAIKYDMLLERDGSNSYYFMERLGDWNDILDLWQGAHQQYKNPGMKAPSSSDSGSYGSFKGSGLSRNIFEEED